MKKFLLVLVVLALVVFGIKQITKSAPETITIHPSGFKTALQLETTSKVIFLMRNEVIFIKNDRTHCLRKVLFFDLSSGVVECGHQAMTSVYHVFGNDNLPKNFYITREELQR
jgi:hypothetical protein